MKEFIEWILQMPSRGTIFLLEWASKQEQWWVLPTVFVGIMVAVLVVCVWLIRNMIKDSKELKLSIAGKIKKFKKDKIEESRKDNIRTEETSCDMCKKIFYVSKKTQLDFCAKCDLKASLFICVFLVSVSAVVAIWAFAFFKFDGLFFFVITLGVSLLIVSRVTLVLLKTTLLGLRATVNYIKKN